MRRVDSHPAPKQVFDFFFSGVFQAKLRDFTGSRHLEAHGKKKDKG